MFLHNKKSQIKLMIKKILFTVFTELLISLSSAQSSTFITTRQHQFFLNNKPYYYISANYWYGGLIGVEKDKKRGIERLRKELDFLSKNGVKSLRVLGGAEGSGLISGVQRIAPPLQPQKGIFDNDVIRGLDILLDELDKRNMKAVIYLSNNWEWSGGFQQYLIWNRQVPDSQKTRKLTWDEQRDIVSKFYTCDECKEDYLKQVNFIISHINSISHKRYIEDPAIMAWELANEPRPMRPESNATYSKWISNVAAYIKSKDKNHLITTGHEGYIGTESTELFEEVHADKNIDYLTIHIWPKNWSWFKDTSIQKDLTNIFSKTEAYITQHISVAEKLQKPLVIEEFGLPRNNQSFDITSSTDLRDSYYKKIFSILEHSAETNGVIGGAGFWAFGGTARPIKNQVFWKHGDEYMGDPPMEEQGLNTVFDSDKSTWQIINHYAVSIGQNNNHTKIDFPADKQATLGTKNLYNNLKLLLNKGIMFGHQDDLAYGVGWKYVDGKSDVKEVTGDYPAIYGFELGHLEINQPVNLDSVPFDKIKQYISIAYKRGGVITLSWHLNNPLTGKTAWDPAPGTVASILPGGSKHELYKTWLDKIATFILSLKGNNGEYIPIIFRPFHELNGNWFWWGKDHCSPEEFKQLWHFTISYLRDTKNVHNLLYAYNTDKFFSKEEYLVKYPGDEWTDILGFDIYQRTNGSQGNEEFIKYADSMLTNLEAIAQDKNKIPALTEFGYPQVKDSAWWTNVFWKTLRSHKVSYALAWRSAGLNSSGGAEFYIPYKGQQSEKDFIKMYNEPATLFQGDVSEENLYKKRN